MRYNFPDLWDEPAVQEEYCCEKCERYEGRLATAAEHFNEVLHQLYSKLPLDIRELEKDLDEIACALRVNMRQGKPRIERSEVRKQLQAAYSWQDWYNNFSKGPKI